MKTTLFNLAKQSVLKLSILSVAVAAGSAAQAAPSEQDVRTLVAHYRTMTYTLQQPVLIYYWFDGAKEKGPWLNQIKANDPAGAELLRAKTSTYRQWLQSDPTSEQTTQIKVPMGMIDPVANSWGGGHGEYGMNPLMNSLGRIPSSSPVCEGEECGGGGMVEKYENWVLAQVTVPAGLTVLNLARDGANSVPLAVESILDRNRCPVQWKKDYLGLNMNRFFQASNKVPAECRALLDAVFFDKIRINALIEMGSGSYFDECKATQAKDIDVGYAYAQSRDWRNSGLTILSPDVFTTESVKVFTPKSTDDFETRHRIQSLFYRSNFDTTAINFQTADMSLSWASGVVTGNDYKLSMETSECPNFVAGKGCSGQLKVCERDQEKWEIKPETCKMVDAPKPPVYPAVMSDKTPPTTDEYSYGNKLLWKDMEGKKADASIGTWVKKNLYGCSDAVPYKRRSKNK